MWECSGRGFYQAFPRVSTASDKRWSEKAWVRGYQTTRNSYNTASACHVPSVIVVLTFQFSQNNVWVRIESVELSNEQMDWL